MVGGEVREGCRQDCVAACGHCVQGGWQGGGQHCSWRAHNAAACVLLLLLLAQVSVAEERHRGLKEALEVDIVSIGGQADKIKVRWTCGLL